MEAAYLSSLGFCFNVYSDYVYSEEIKESVKITQRSVLQNLYSIVRHKRGM